MIPNQYLTAFGVSQEAAFQGYNNTQIKSLVIQQSSELNATLRLQEVNQINYLMNKDVFEVWLYYPQLWEREAMAESASYSAPMCTDSSLTLEGQTWVSTGCGRAKRKKELTIGVSLMKRVPNLPFFSE